MTPFGPTFTGNITVASQQGWECPKCGAVMAPWMVFCKTDHSEKGITTVTTTNAAPAHHKEDR